MWSPHQCSPLWLAFLQSSVYVLPEDVSVLASLWPAQISALLHHLPHAVVRGELVVQEVFHEEQDQHILLLIKQAEAVDTMHWFRLYQMTRLFDLFTCFHKSDMKTFQNK